MTKNWLIVLFIPIFFNSCATWKGVQQDSKTAWEATKETSSEAYHGVKKSIHEATAD